MLICAQTLYLSQIFLQDRILRLIYSKSWQRLTSAALYSNFYLQVFRTEVLCSPNFSYWLNNFAAPFLKNHNISAYLCCFAVFIQLYWCNSLYILCSLYFIYITNFFFLLFSKDALNWPNVTKYIYDVTNNLYFFLKMQLFKKREREREAHQHIRMISEESCDKTEVMMLKIQLWFTGINYIWNILKKRKEKKITFEW